MRKKINESDVNAAVKRRAFTLIELLVVIAVIAILAAFNAAAQMTMTKLFNFNGQNGAYPNPLLFSSNVLYGTTIMGNTNLNADPANTLDGTGTIFRINTDGTCFTNLYNFSPDTNIILSIVPPYPGWTTEGANADGVEPPVGLTLYSNMLYGIAQGGGSNGVGTIFKLNTDGTGFVTLHDFSLPVGGMNWDGCTPNAPVLVSDGVVYGTAGGGLYGDGVVWKINTDGSNFVTLYNFSWDNYNADGKYPSPARLVLSSNTLYGTTEMGGFAYPGFGGGTIYKINTDGTGYTNLYVFPDNGSLGNVYGELILNSNAFYGAALAAGTNGKATLFKINTDGTGYTNFFTFDELDGAGDLILTNNIFYGLDNEGVFSINLDGTGFTNLFLTGDFHSLILVSNTFYAAGAVYTNVYGTIFALGPSGPSQPVINSIVLNTNNAVTIFCSGSADFVYWMQATTNLAPPISWQTISTNLADTNGNWQITDSLTNGGVFVLCQTNLIYSGSGSIDPGQPEPGSTNVIGTNVSCNCTSMRFYRAAAPQ